MKQWNNLQIWHLFARSSMHPRPPVCQHRPRYTSTYHQVQKLLQVRLSWIVPPAALSFTGICSYYWYRKHTRQCKIQKACMKGSCPKVTVDPPENKIDRPDIQQKILDNFIRPSAVNMFGVIIGPTGTGKTTATRIACHIQPKGVFYFELEQPKSSVPKAMAKCIGMDLEPTFLDGYLPINVHYNPPDDITKGLKYVLDELREVKRKFQLEFPITVFIDGIDLMAKNSPEEFGMFVDTAKVLATQGEIRIVFVSSEGHVIPIIMKHSKQRCRIIEILDLCKEDAMKYLSYKSPEMSEKVKDELINFVGGRFIYLNSIASIYKDIMNDKGIDEDELMSELKKEVEAITVGRSLDIIKPNERDVLRRMLQESSDQPLSIKQITDKCSTDIEYEQMEKATTELVKRNVLKYDIKGSISFHNKCIKAAVKRRIK